VDRMSIGEFARDSRLSAKALRLYDERMTYPPSEVGQDSYQDFAIPFNGRPRG